DLSPPQADPDPDPDFGEIFPSEDGEWQGQRVPLAPPASFSSKPLAKPSYFRVGDLVRHPELGSGKVFMVDKKKILVQFFASGIKMLLLDQCNLTRE
ncbi:MAG: hypothetical protein LBU79_01750, partial [Planctomycetota bacterium]|nr:hypothetical protein [Planctomycetota bacterium]